VLHLPLTSQVQVPICANLVKQEAMEAAAVARRERLLAAVAAAEAARALAC